MDGVTEDKIYEVAFMRLMYGGNEFCMCMWAGMALKVFVLCGCENKDLTQLYM